MVHKSFLLLLPALFLVGSPGYAINKDYRKALERSGCTQASEAQGCDIHKSKTENAKAGFVTESTPASSQNLSDRQKQERSGCPRVSELHDCDINNPHADNAAGASPYTGNWIATFPETGATVAYIRIDSKEQVWVNNKKLHARKSDGALVFKDGSITYTIQGDRRIRGQDIWSDSDAGTKGPINAQ